MPRATLADVESIDPLLNNNFDLTISPVPGGGDGRALRISCLGTTIPPTTLLEAELELHGFKFVYVAGVSEGNELQIALQEHGDFRIYNIIREWQKKCKTYKTQSGATAPEYKATGVINIYNSVGEIAQTFNIYGLWPKENPETELTGEQQGTLVRRDVQFAFDWKEPASEATTIATT